MYIHPHGRVHGGVSCLLGSLRSSASVPQVFCRSCSTCRCISDVFVGRKVISTSYSSAILKVCPRPLNTLEFTQLWGEGFATIATQLYICTSAIRSVNHLSEDRSLIFGGHYFPPWLPQVVGKLLQEYMYSCLLWGCEWETGDCYHAKKLKLTTINHYLLSKPSFRICKPLRDSRAPKQLHQSDSVSASLVQVVRWIPGALYSKYSPDSSSMWF